jgi:hypothetical protein
MLKVILGIAWIIVYLSPSEWRYRRQQALWVKADRPSLDYRDIEPNESQK